MVVACDAKGQIQCDNGKALYNLACSGLGKTSSKGDGIMILAGCYENVLVGGLKQKFSSDNIFGNEP